MPDPDEIRARAAQRPNDDVIAAVLEDHADILSLMNDVSTATSDRRPQAFECLVGKIAVHETAEEEVVHPLTRHSAVRNADSVVDARLAEESKGKEALSELEKIGTDAPEFQEKFEAVRREVISHAEHEEQEELPKLEEVDRKQLARAAKAFRAAQKLAPTHAHPHTPESATGNLVVGPFVAMADRARDAVRHAMHDNPSM